MHQALRGNAHAHPLRLATSCVGHGHHCTRYTMLATVIVSMLCIVTPADSVKLTFTKNEGSGKKVFSVEDATDDAPTPPEGTIIIAALSTCHNTLRRVAIRNTWAKFPGDWTLKFFMSDCPSALHENSAQHHAHDLVFTNITDEYHSIPAKSAAIFAYAKEIKAKWAFKTDDDSFVNVPKLLDTMAKTKQNYIGRFHQRSWPFRDPKNKWYVSEKQYPTKLGAYPPFGAGVGYAFRNDALDCILPQVANTETYAKTMWLEDVYMGLLSKDCKLSQKEIGPIYLDPNEWKKKGRSSTNFILVHYVKEGSFMHLWKLMNSDPRAQKELSSDPLSMCSYTPPSGADHCKATAPNWKTVDANRACEGSGLKRFDYTERAGSLECCKQWCQLHCSCIGIDYYSVTDWCNIYNAECPKKPKLKKEGSSHHFLDRGAGWSGLVKLGTNSIFGPRKK